MTGWIWWCAGGAVVMVVLLMLLQRHYVKPARIIRRGMELLSSQETNNRLRLTGNPAADKVARLFNSLMERLQEQVILNRQQNRLMTELIGASPMGVIMMDYDGCIIEVNDAARKFLEFESGDIIGRRMSQLSSPLGVALGRLPKGKMTVRVSETDIYLCRRLDFIDHGFSRPFILIDNMADELRQVEKEAYGKVIRIMAHEVNNTMGGLKALLDVMTQTVPDDPLLMEAIRSGTESCDRLGEFVDSYAELARLPEPEKKPLSLMSYLSAVLPFLQSVAAGRAEVDLCDVEGGISLSDPESDVTVMADPAQLERVLVNIVKNSAEAMPDDHVGRITLSAKAGNGEVVLTVCNNGKPIPDSGRADLFRPFFTTKPGGRGTGLALVAEILGCHGWRYTLNTDADGLTRFRIRIPCGSGHRGQGAGIRG